MFQSVFKASAEPAKAVPVEFYRVTDNLSRFPLEMENGRGFNASIPVPIDASPSQALTTLNFNRQLDWRNREPTTLISLWEGLDKAKDCAQKRAKGAMAWKRGPIRIWSVRLPAGTRWRKQGGYNILCGPGIRIVSGADAWIEVGQFNQGLIASSEWFALGHIPPNLVEMLFEL